MRIDGIGIQITGAQNAQSASLVSLETGDVLIADVQKSEGDAIVLKMPDGRLLNARLLENAILNQNDRVEFIVTQSGDDGLVLRIAYVEPHVSEAVPQAAASAAEAALLELFEQSGIRPDARTLASALRMIQQNGLTLKAAFFFALNHMNPTTERLFAYQALTSGQNVGEALYNAAQSLHALLKQSPDRTQAPVQAQAYAPTQAQAQAQTQAQTLAQAQVPLQVPAQELTHSQAQVQEQAQAQTPAQAQAQVQAPVQAQAQAPAQAQAQTPVHEQIQLQVPIQDQTQAKTQAQTQAQTQAKTQTNTQPTQQNGMQTAAGELSAAEAQQTAVASTGAQNIAGADNALDAQKAMQSASVEQGLNTPNGEGNAVREGGITAPAQTAPQTEAAQVQSLAEPVEEAVKTVQSSPMKETAAMVLTGAKGGLLPNAAELKELQKRISDLFLRLTGSESGADIKKFISESKERREALKFLTGKYDEDSMRLVQPELTRVEAQSKLAEDVTRFSYYQLPVYNGEYGTAELFVYRRAKSKGKIDADNASVLISIPTESFGRVETLLRTELGTLSINFSVERQSGINVLKEGVREFRKTLAAKTKYHLGEMRVGEMKERTTVENAESVLRGGVIRSGAIDVKI